MMNDDRARNTNGRAGEAPRGDAPAGAPSSRRRGPPPPRDQAPSSFTTILERLLRSTACARGAALVDFEGETVDYAGHLDPFELKVAAATWQIALAEVCATSYSEFTQIVVRAARSSFVLRRVNDQYALVLVLHARAAFAVSSRALSEAECALASEAGWSRGNRPTWFSVTVRMEAGAEHRPASVLITETWQPVEVIGALMGLRARERGYRVRLPLGAEMMLIRERNGRWFCDELPAALVHSRAPAKARS